MQINGRKLKRGLKIGTISVFVFLCALYFLAKPKNIDTDLDNSKNIDPVLEVASEQPSEQVSVSTLPTVEISSCPNPYGEDNIYKVVSKTDSLGEYFVPEDLVEVGEDISRNADICLKSGVLDSLERMFADASLVGHDLEVTSAFRSYSYQNYLFNMYFEKDGEDAKRYSAQPGHSEHQLGTTVDITAKGLPSTYHFFHTTDAGKWVLDHADEYGFVMSYPDGSEDVTGYMFEPWHYRYVGEEMAKSIGETGTTLYEYLLEYEKNIDSDIKS